MEWNMNVATIQKVLINGKFLIHDNEKKLIIGKVPFEYELTIQNLEDEYFITDDKTRYNLDLTSEELKTVYHLESITPQALAEIYIRSMLEYVKLIQQMIYDRYDIDDDFTVKLISEINELIKNYERENAMKEDVNYQRFQLALSS